MKKKILAILLACAMVVPTGIYPVMAEEETTEAATEEAAAEEEASDETMLIMQGTDDLGIVWTLVIDTENVYACVALTPEGEETTYVYGPIAFDEEGTSFTITDDEDGADYTFGYQDVSATETILTYEETGSEVQLAVVEQSTVAGDENMSVYAGVEDDGSQLTVGFDWDTYEMAIDERDSDGNVTQLSGTFTVADDLETVTFADADGNTIEMTVVDVEGTENQIDLTIEDTTVRLSLVDMSAVSAVTGE